MPRFFGQHPDNLLPLQLTLQSGEEIFLDPYQIETACDHRFFLPVLPDSPPDTLPVSGVCCKVTTRGGSGFFLSGTAQDFSDLLLEWQDKEADKRRAERAILESSQLSAPEGTGAAPFGLSPEKMQEALDSVKPLIKSTLQAIREAREELDAEGEEP